MSEKKKRTHNRSISLIVLLCLLLVISIDFNLRYLFANKHSDNANGAENTSSAVAKKGSIPFKGLCKRYGFLQPSEVASLISLPQRVIGIDGEVQAVTANQWLINPEPKLTVSLYTDSQTKVNGRFKTGDCVSVFYANDSSNRAVLILPQ